MDKKREQRKKKQKKERLEEEAEEEAGEEGEGGWEKVKGGVPLVKVRRLPYVVIQHVWACLDEPN